GGGNSYDFGARMLDPRIGRWMSPDPLMDLFPSQSPYSTFDNNPIFWIDPNGAAPQSNDKDKEKEKEKEKTKVNVLIGPKDKTWSGNEKTKDTKQKDVDAAMMNFISNAKSESELIVIEATNIDDALVLLKEALGDDKEIENLFIASHGGYKNASFRIGNNGANGSLYHAWSVSNDKKLKKLGESLSDNSNVILMGCHAGSYHNGGDKLVQNLSIALNATVYANQSWGWSPQSNLFYDDTWTNLWGAFDDPYYQAGYSNPAEFPYASRKQAYDNAGKWTKASPVLEKGEAKANLETVNAVYYKANGTIGVSDFDWSETQENKVELKKVKELKD
ncbi:DUF4347 domain-containing protein, partial [Psychroserpens mesophilus]|uniref:DUF4347 domain-containing protein n=1 Tax=Psychroserpens mesophilus TaxID=325473 RepID=UPI00058C9D1B